MHRRRQRRFEVDHTVAEERLDLGDRRDGAHNEGQLVVVGVVDCAVRRAQDRVYVQGDGGDGSV